MGDMCEVFSFIEEQNKMRHDEMNYAYNIDGTVSKFLK